MPKRDGRSAHQTVKFCRNTYYAHTIIGMWKMTFSQVLYNVYYYDRII